MTKNKRVVVPEEDRAKLLLWCERNCCFCGKECTTNIVIHHIDGNPRNNKPDNLVPLCGTCHNKATHGEITKEQLLRRLGIKKKTKKKAKRKSTRQRRPQTPLERLSKQIKKEFG